MTKVELLALFLSTPFASEDLHREFGLARMGTNMLVLTMMAHGHLQVHYDDPPQRRYKLAKGADALEVAALLLSADAEHRVS